LAQGHITKMWAISVVEPTPIPICLSFLLYFNHNSVWG
jgi:hypothetical protein